AGVARPRHRGSTAADQPAVRRADEISQLSSAKPGDAVEPGPVLRLDSAGFVYAGVSAMSDPTPAVENDRLGRVWDVIEQVGVCMLTTQFAGGLRARPVEARPDRDAGLIFFVTDIRSAKEDEIEARPDIGLVFIDSNDNAYLSITGRASVTRDADKTRAAWRKTDEVWWPGGPNDSNVCLLQFEPFT